MLIPGPLRDEGRAVRTQYAQAAARGDAHRRGVAGGHVAQLARGQIEDAVRAMKLGAVDFVTKPFQSEEIVARVNTHLTVQRLQRDLLGRNEELQRQLRVAEEFLKEAQETLEKTVKEWEAAYGEVKID